ncbi:MAG: rRNA maturation RNase YbeY [Bdellovibrionales bacterium]|nr:rRNA maturation RNase YbeY [Bdellovibrionales bacterium]
MASSPSEHCWQIDITIRPSCVDAIDEVHTHSFLSKCLKHLPHDRISRTACELSVLFTDDNEIQILNAQYRNKNAPTDVLSFSAQEGDPGPIPLQQCLGDLVISVDTARRQAKEYGVTLNEELARLLIHGTLHLLGFDHENVEPAEAEAMFQLQDDTQLELSSFIDEHPLLLKSATTRE